MSSARAGGGKGSVLTRPADVTVKSTTALLAVLFPVLVRLTEIALGLYVTWTFWNDGHDNRYTILGGILFISSCCEGTLAAVRQWATERLHHPALSFALGFLHLQPLVEAYDTYRTGRKTGCLKLLGKVGAATYSLPSAFMLSYLAFEHIWRGDWTWSIGLSCFNLTLTLISAEKELYIRQGLGKLRLLSPYSVVLFCYRAVEVPARILTLALFAAQFSHYVWVVIGADLLVLALVRESSERRRVSKAHRSREALTRSLSQLGKSIEDVRALGLIDDDELAQKPLSGFDLVAHYGVWVLVFWEGIDAIPFLMLRLLEFSVVVSLLQIFGDLGDYETAPVVVTLVLAGVYFLSAPLWHFFRSHATFLHPTFRTPTRVQLATMQKANRQPGVSLERYHQEDPEAVPPVASGAPVAAAAASPEPRTPRGEAARTTALQQQAPLTPRERRYSTSSELSPSEPSDTEAGSESDAAEDAADLHTRAMEASQPAVAPVKQVPEPPQNLATSSSQYNWEGHFVDEAMVTSEPVAAPSGTRREADGDAKDEDGCVVM